MDPSISEVVNRIIYGWQLEDGANVCNNARPGLQSIREWLGSLWKSEMRGTPSASNTILVQLRPAPQYQWGSSQRVGSTSRANLQTATIAVLLAHDAPSSGAVTGNQLYIATFYRKKYTVITALIAELELFAGVEVVTVDGSQGRERDLGHT
jgi:superfamily I DNA and/or RNA helicase